jgi:hypothetical protein
MTANVDLAEWISDLSDRKAPAGEGEIWAKVKEFRVAVAKELAEQQRAEAEGRAVAAEERIQALTEATVMWRDRPGGDVGLAIALAGILDTEKPEPPAATALVRVLSECDRIEREVYGQHDEDDDGMREAVRRIRAAATEPLTRAAIDGAEVTS